GRLSLDRGGVRSRGLWSAVRHRRGRRRRVRGQRGPHLVGQVDGGDVLAERNERRRDRDRPERTKGDVRIGGTLGRVTASLHGFTFVSASSPSQSPTTWVVGPIGWNVPALNPARFERAHGEPGRHWDRLSARPSEIDAVFTRNARPLTSG